MEHNPEQQTHLQKEPVVGEIDVVGLAIVLEQLLARLEFTR